MISVYKGKIRWNIGDDRREQLKKIYVGKGNDVVDSIYRQKVIKGILLVAVFGVLCVGVSIVLSVSDGIIRSGYYIEKSKPEGEDREVNIHTQIGDSERDVTVEVPAKIYTDDELCQMMKHAKKYVLNNYLGDNTDAENIRHDLNLIKKIPGNAVTVSWKSDKSEVIDENGAIDFEDIKDETVINLTAVFKYRTAKQTQIYSLVLKPLKKTYEEKLWEKWTDILEKEKIENSTKSRLKLPQEVDGIAVKYSEQDSSNIMLIIAFVFVGVLAVPVIIDSRIKSELSRRENELKNKYPELIEKYILLISAGMTIKSAWYKITDDMEKNADKSYLWKEMSLTKNNMENGMNESKAYELFGKRTGVLPYMKFSTVLVQNLRKGSADIMKILEYEAVDVLKQKRDNACALGEQAGTKLLFPMMIMLVEVCGIIIFAAFQSI